MPTPTPQSTTTLTTLRKHFLTQAQYDALYAAGEIVQNDEYYILDGNYNPTSNSLAPKIKFDVRSVKMPIYLNYSWDMTIGTVVSIDTSWTSYTSEDVKVRNIIQKSFGGMNSYGWGCGSTSSGIITVLGGQNEGNGDYYDGGIVYGYYNLSDERFYYDSEYNEELGHYYTVYVDKNSGNLKECYVYQQAKFFELNGDPSEVSFPENFTGYYNENTGIFYSDSGYTQILYVNDGEIGRDINTDKYYMFIDSCYLRDTFADWLISKHGAVAIPLVAAQGKYYDAENNSFTGMEFVKFQTLIDNDELSIIGTVMDSTDGTIDLWSANLSINKYENMANKVQTISKSSADAYPSTAAVISYIQNL